MERVGARCTMPGLEPVLEAWTALMNMDHPRASWGDDDAPWWYGERASLSQFAGAIWQSRGWCFEEYRVFRREGFAGSADSAYGRCDLAFEVGEAKAIIEAKAIWPTTLSPLAVRAQIEASLASAAQQVSGYQGPEGYDSLSLCFAAPSLATAPTDAHIEELVSSLDGCIAWAFPKATQALPSKLNGRIYPGVVLGLAAAGAAMGKPGLA